MWSKGLYRGVVVMVERRRLKDLIRKGKEKRSGKVEKGESKKLARPLVVRNTIAPMDGGMVGGWCCKRTKEQESTEQ